MNPNFQQQLTQPQYNSQDILMNQPPQPPPQQQNITNSQNQTDFANKSEIQTNNLQSEYYSKENSVQIPSNFGTINNTNSIGGFNNPQKVIIPTNVNPQQYRNIPRRNTVSAKSNPTPVFFDQSPSEPNNKQNAASAPSVPQNTNNLPKGNSIPNNPNNTISNNKNSPRVQFQQNPNSQIQFNVEDQHTRPRRQSEMTKHNVPPQNQQQKPRRVSEMQPNPHPYTDQSAQIQQNNQQCSQRPIPTPYSQQQQYYQTQNQQPNQTRLQQFQQNQPPRPSPQQNLNQPYSNQIPQNSQVPQSQQQNQIRTQQYQQNPQQNQLKQQQQQINQPRQQFQQQNQQFQPYPQNKMNPNQFRQQQFQQQNQQQYFQQQQRFPPNNQQPNTSQNNQIPFSRPRGQTTKVYQPPVGYPGMQQNLPKNMNQQPRQLPENVQKNQNHQSLPIYQQNNRPLYPGMPVKQQSQNQQSPVPQQQIPPQNQQQQISPQNQTQQIPQRQIPPQQVPPQNQQQQQILSQNQQQQIPPQIPQRQNPSQNQTQQIPQRQNPSQNQTQQIPQRQIPPQQIPPQQIPPQNQTQQIPPQNQTQQISPQQIPPQNQQQQNKQPEQQQTQPPQQESLQPVQSDPLNGLEETLQPNESDQQQSTVIPPLPIRQNILFNQQPNSNSNSASPSSSPNGSPIRIQSDILNYLDENGSQYASSAPLMKPMQSPIPEEILSTNKRVSFDESVSGIIGGKLISSDEANKINDSDSSDSPVDAASINQPRRNSNAEKQEEVFSLTKESKSLDDIIAESFVNCPLAHQINDEECKVLDSTVQKLIDSQLKPKKLRWFGCYVVSCSSQTNPYLDNLALEFSSRPEYKDNRTVKLFSASIRHLKLNPVLEDLSAHFFAAPSSVMRLNDALVIKDRSKILPIVKKPIQSSPNCYVRKYKADNIVFKVKDITPMPLPKRRYLNLSLMSYEFKLEKSTLEKVEPFYLCGYLVNNGEMISEPWFFGPSETKQFNPNIKLNQNGSFELPTVSLSDVYFVIIVLRKLLPENGAAINKYYKSPGAKTLSAAKEQAKNIYAYPGVFAPYAWTFLDVDTIVRTKSLTFKMPQPFLITGMIKPLYRSLRSVSGTIVPIDITFRVGLQNDVIHPYELTFTNDCVLSLITYPPEIPRFSIYHCFYIRIISATLHTKKRNIYAHLTLKKGETELPLIYYPYRIGKSTKSFTKCWYHEKKPIFDDLYICSLPNPIPPDFIIYIKFYNAVLKNLSNGKGSLPDASYSSESVNDLQEPNPSTSELIGIAKIPLITEEGDFIPDGVKTFGVLHLAENQLIPNCLTLETHLNSSFVSSNPMLNHFYNKINADTMTQIETSDAVINLFNLLDQLVVGITTDPEESVKSLVELSRKVTASKPEKPENKTDFINFSSKYAASFSFISDSSISVDFHRNLLRNWALLIETDLNYRISLRAQNQINPDTSNSNANLYQSSNILSMSNLSLSSSNLNTSNSAQVSQSSSVSQFNIPMVSSRSTQGSAQSISPRSAQGSVPVSPRSSQNSPRRTSNADNYQNEVGSNQNIENVENETNIKLNQNSSSNILSSDMMEKIQADCIYFSNTERSDFYLIDFFFLLIIKSLYLTNDQDFGAEFNEFTTSWSKNFNRYQIESYSMFINLLFDIGHYTYACHAIGKQVLQIISSKQSSELLLPFLTQVLRPRLFYPSVLLIDDFVQLIQTIIIYAKKHKAIFNGVFDILLRIFVHYNNQMKEEVASRLIDVYTTLCDSNQLPIKSEEDAAVYFYVYLFQSTTFDAFQDWISRQNSRTVSLLFKTIQWLINYVKKDELARVLHFAILNIMTHMMKLKNKSYTLNISLIVYNLFCCNLAMDFIPDLVTFFGNLVELYYMWLIESSVPTIARHIAKILDLSCYCPNEANEFFKKLFEADINKFNNSRRSMSICCHSLLFIKSINNVVINEDSILYPVVQCLKEYEILRKAKISEEKLCEIKLKRAMMLIHSPDATVQCIDNLISFHQENEYFAEELQVRIFKLALVFEYLGSTGAMDWKYLKVERPSLLFADQCPIIKQCIICPPDGNFRIPSYCDSPPFSERSLICDMMFLISRTIETKMYELGISLIDKFWPIMEHSNKNILISKSFKIFSRCYTESAEIPTDVDRLFGRYFKVSFYGNCFNEENGNSYIYREKKLTHLFEISKRLTEFYSDIYQPTEIELIKEAGTVDASSLDVENKGYIQVTFVEPSFKKKIDKDRILPYEKNHLLTNFFFDTPFTKEGKKAQSTIDQQWIRRTVLTVEHEMPSIRKRVKIIKINDREFPPIRVAYRQLRERITLFQNAITQADYRNIQQLLHGSLLVQVNEGPSRMAELFLADNCEKSKYTSKLESAFKNFLEINEMALEMHGKWVTENPDFVPLQHELESGYASLVEKLSKWIS